MTKLIIAGSRFPNEEFRLRCEEAYIDFIKFLKGRTDISRVVSGTARGYDKVGEWLAGIVGYSVDRFPADWDAHGKAAGYIRNKQMAEYADELLAFWDGESKGTLHMINTMKELGKPVTVITDANPSL